MSHAKHGPPAVRRKPSAATAQAKARTVLRGCGWCRPRGSRVLVLGVAFAVGGVAGALRTLSGGGGLLTAVGQLTIGAAGVLVTLACDLDYAKRRPGEGENVRPWSRGHRRG